MGQTLTHEPPDVKRRKITMAAIIAVALFIIVAVTLFGLALHVLFSPWLLIAAVAIVAWIKFRPSRSHR
jgi:1,4-dihydroxy-2-naphthoate octaprenyltransferase